MYGGVGSIMGHELTHGFDVQGRHYLFIYLFTYFIAFTMITMLKMTRKKYISTSIKNERRRCGTHNGARHQVKCVLTKNTQILIM